MLYARVLRTSVSVSNRFRAIVLAAAVVTGIVWEPTSVFAQSDKWQVDVAPLYLWAAEQSGKISVADHDVPLFMDFGDVADKLAGAFALHVEARKNRWGALADINFIRLSTDATFTTPIIARQIAGTAQLDMTIFEAGATYLVNPERHLSVLGGLRTYTLSPEIEFESDASQLAPVDTSETAAGVFGGLAFRPRLSEKLTLLTRGDLGAGAAFTWSATLGFEYRFKPWGGAMFGYRALGIDTGDADEAATDVEYDMTHYGPFFSLTLHWMQK
jgi:hypothetical protein